MSDQGSEGYTPAPPRDTTAKRAPSTFDLEQEFANKVLHPLNNTGVVIDLRELVDAGHPARQVYSPAGTFLVTVKWLGPQTLKG